MWRSFDFQCPGCEDVRGDYINVPSGKNPQKTLTKRCEKCGCRLKHRRVMSLVAPYLGERMLSPMVSGGTYDTVGNKSPAPLPEFKGESFGDFKDFVNAKEYKEVKAERKVVLDQNKVKKERTRLIKSGANIDVRHHPLPGDPKIMA